MNLRLRRACVIPLTTAMLAAGLFAAGPAHADDPSPTFTKRTTTRTPTAQVQRPTATSEAGSSAAAPVVRLFGPNRIQTALDASYFAWDDAGTEAGNVAMSVVLTRSDEFADALGGAALAGAAQGPLLMTPPTSLHADVHAEIERVLGGQGDVYLLGGIGAISSATETTLKRDGYRVVRVAGNDRYATSVKIAQQVSGWIPPDGVPQFVMATTGQNFPDGLAAGATAGGFRATVVLTKGSTVPGVVSDYLYWRRKAGVPLFAVGGPTAAASYRWDGEFAGRDRYETAAILADAFWGTETGNSPVAIGLSTGLNWPDALAGGAFMAGLGPLLLARTDSLPVATSETTTSLVHLSEPSPIEAGFVFGGESVVGPAPAAQFAAILGN